MPLRIAFAGTPELALPSLEALLASPHRLVGVISQPDRPKGRSRRPTPAPVAALALARGIPLVRPENARDPALAAALAEWRPDVLLVLAFSLLLPEEVLAVPRLGAYNAHASLLPKYRGASPIPAAILAGEKESGVTIFRLVERLDAGPVLLQRRLPLAPDETAGSLGRKTAALSAEALLEALALLESGSPALAPQDEARASYAPKLGKADGRLDWSRGAEELDRRVRAMNPWPGGFTFLPGAPGAPVAPPVPPVRLKIHRLRPAPEAATAAGAPPGTLLPSPRFLVACGAEGREAVELLEVQAEGGKALAAGAFLRGHQLAPGTRLLQEP